MLYLAWDIDGTLLLTNRAGYDALQEATQEYFHLKEPYQFKHSLAGCTDSAIIKEIVTEIKGRCTSGWAAGLMPVSYTHLDVYKRQGQSTGLQRTVYSAGSAGFRLHFHQLYSLTE